MGAILIFILLALMWVLLIVPRQRELKRHKALVAELEPGDRVMTGAGVYGAIEAIEGDYVRLLVAPDLAITVARRAIASRVAPDAAIPDGWQVTERLDRAED